MTTHDTASKAAQAFTRGQRVILARARHAEFVGETGRVRRVIKSRNAVEVELEDGRLYDADPARLDPCSCKTCGSEIVETVNGSTFRDGECGMCEYTRYRTPAETGASPPPEVGRRCASPRVRTTPVEGYGHPVPLLLPAPMNTPHDILGIALDARGKGLVAIPCHPGTKVPMVKWKEWQREMPPVELQREWFRTRTNVALICAGLIIFDCDEATKADLVLAECGDTPHKLTTPRGGIHLGYRRRQGVQVANQVKIKGMPIDIRTDGGLEMIPTSETEHGRYEWIGEGLLPASALPVAKIGWTRTRVRRALRPIEPPADSDALVRRARAYLARVEGAQSGHRGHDRTMRVAGILIQKFGLSIEQAWPLILKWNERCEPPWSEKELLHKLQDAERLRGTYRRG